MTAVNPQTERILAIADNLVKTNQIKSERAFALAIELDPGAFSAAKSGKRSIPEKKFDTIAAKFNVNINYIKHGELPMFNSKIVDIKTQTNAFAISNLQEVDDNSPFIDLGNGQYIMVVPHVQEYAHAGYASSGFSDHEFLEELPKHTFIVNKQHRGKYIAFTVIGDSMDNDKREAIPEGMIVTGREIKRELWRSRFHIHRFKDYIIVHKEGILVKRIIDQDVEQGIITCHSLNENKNIYPDFTLNLDDCHQIFNIVNKSEEL